MARVFKVLFLVKFLAFDETEAGSAGTQPAKGQCLKLAIIACQICHPAVAVVLDSQSA
jgi:hypothetical protein